MTVITSRVRATASGTAVLVAVMASMSACQPSPGQAVAHPAASDLAATWKSTDGQTMTFASDGTIEVTGIKISAQGGPVTYTGKGTWKLGATGTALPSEITINGTGFQPRPPEFLLVGFLCSAKGADFVSLDTTSDSPCAGTSFTR